MASEKKEDLKSDKKHQKNDAYKGINPPVIELPKGGGAIKSVDEKFSVNAVNGTSAFSFPLPFSSSGAMKPDLTLSYNSGSGNGIFGMGWSLSLPSIRRKTEKELPQYRDDEDSDTYLFSQEEDLVPVLKKAGAGWEKDEHVDTSGVYMIRFYRPRIEGTFSRIERWTKKSNGIIHWRVITKDNITTVFGKAAAAKIYDPGDGQHIFEWLPELVYDDKGHCVSYVYKKEDGKQLDASLLHERNRVNGFAKFTNTYLKRILYGNTEMYLPAMGDTLPAKFLFETAFDYGEHSKISPPFGEINEWIYRSDAFSDYHAGFEIRTCRRCERVLFYHHIPELPGGSALVHGVDFRYENNGIDGFTFLTAITGTGYIKKEDGTYSHKSTPPFSFEYQKHEWNTEVREITRENLAHAPAGIDEPRYQWIDLHSEGLSGMLTEQAGEIFYKSNLGNGKFSPAKQIGFTPSFKNLQVKELEGNGVKYFVQLESEPKGFFELREDDAWQPFRSFGKLPNLNFKDKQIQQVDLDGDGVADLLISEDDVFTWYPSKGKNGYGPARQTLKTDDEEEGPAMIFNDESQAVFLADMNGDGITDIVRVRNGEVAWWPSLGYGRFGAKITMDHAPLFDAPEKFNTKFLQLADIDGSGTPDVVYLGKANYKIWINRQGNSFAEQALEIASFPGINAQAKVSMLDLMGNGVSCIVWNCPLPAHAAPLKYIDLVGGKKPHVMTVYRNNMGKEVFLEYKPSTHYYLEDKKAGVPWITRIPFPVQCVSKTIVFDRIRKLRFASEYTYHHGYYDSIEREFRGFGRVDQTDAESIDHFVKNSGGMLNNIEEQDLQQHPVLTKSWFHTGAFTGGTKIQAQFEKEYFRNNAHPEYKMPEPMLELLVDNEDWREACRACKGTLLRKEVYALDGDVNLEKIPYVAEQHNVMVKRVQEKLVNKHGVFLVHESESVIYHYERDPANPRILHKFNIEIDAYGNLIRSAEVAYGCFNADADLVVSEQDVQKKMHITCTWNSFTDAITSEENAYRLPILWQARTYEITGNDAPAAAPYFSFGEMDKATDPNEGTDLLYHETPAGGLERRLIEWVRTRYRADDGSTELNFGKIKSKALVHETYKAAFTDALLDELLTGKTTSGAIAPALTATTAEGGGYVKLDGHYWIPSGRQNYLPAEFFLSTEFTDPFGKKVAIEYGPHHLFISKSTNQAGSIKRVKQFNYRALQPLQMEDENENITAVRYDALNIVTAVFIVGKGGDKGDAFDGSKDEASAADEPGIIYTYKIDSWYNQWSGGLDTSQYYKPEPNYFHSKTWAVHYKARTPGSTEYQEAITYFDGSGKPVLTKTQAEPGPARRVKNDGTVEIVNTFPNKRWIGNGRTILNNKSNVVKQYEPYFSVDALFDDEKEMVELGVTNLLSYDPLDRQIKTKFANGAFTSMQFSSWKQISKDENDTIADSDWNTRMLDYLQSLPDSTAELQARKLLRIAQHQQTNTDTQAHANTPAITYTDALGRPFLSVADNKTEKLKRLTTYDIEGNEREVRDALGRLVTTYAYDMLGNQVSQKNMDAGKRWFVNDIGGHPILSYDDRDFIFNFSYDELRRPVAFFVTESMVKKTFSRLEYGEGVTDDKKNNLRGKVYKQFDQAGLVTYSAYDFKGNLLSSSRKLCEKFDQTIDWVNPAAVLMEAEEFVSSTAYNALNRPVSMITPHTATIPGSEIIPGYNEAGELTSMKAKLRGSPTETEFVVNIAYNEKRQRESILYKNGTLTSYEYDPFKFHLTGLLTTRSAPPGKLQDLIYAHDPVGNITAIYDNAQEETFYGGEHVLPANKFLYDALYRLTYTEGRKHIGQNVIDHGGVSNNFRNHPFISNAGVPGPDVADAFCKYNETYVYDKAGNLQSQTHAASKFPWTRTFKYGHPVAGDNKCNRLRETTVGAATFTYDYDAHGNMKKLEHLPVVEWNYKDQLVHAHLGGGGDAWYAYDYVGERVRKVILDNMGRKQKERIYIGSFEIYREYDVAGIVALERESLSVFDDKRRVALVETQTIDKKIAVPAPVILQRYQYDNHLRSAALELDENAALISYEEYYPFGASSYQAGKGTKEVPLKRYRYVGKERDEESGLGYHSARYYVPWLCRWASADPIGIKDGLNVFVYANNTPVNANDTNGREYFYSPDGAFVKKEGKGNGVFILDGTTKIDLHVSISDFRFIVGTVTRETSDPKDKKAETLAETTREAAGIYDVLENRKAVAKNPAKTSIRTIIKTTGVYGKDSKQAKAIAADDTTAKTLRAADVDLDKLKAVRKGVIQAMQSDNSVHDFSGGATTWHGKDFAITTYGAYKSYYLKGFVFTKPEHDIWKMGDKDTRTVAKIPFGKKTTKDYVFHHKYESTEAAGQTLFMKRTPESFAKGYEQTIGKALYEIKQIESSPLYQMQTDMMFAFPPILPFGINQVMLNQMAVMNAELKGLQDKIDRVMDKSVRDKARY